MRVSEVYASTQGEGPNVGRTTVFVRFGGCNLRCPGWPCDTQHAIDPAYRHEWLKQAPGFLVDRVHVAAQMAGASLITLTGGEPFLQPNAELEGFVSDLIDHGYKVEAFTNGTLTYPDWAVDNVSMIMDWKLRGSGEDWQNAERFANLDRLNESVMMHSVKFVCKDLQDMYLADSIWRTYFENTNKEYAFEIFYGKVWDGEIEDKDLVAYVMKNKLPWRLNRQEHNYIWPANERGR